MVYEIKMCWGKKIKLNLKNVEEVSSKNCDNNFCKIKTNNNSFE